MKLGGVALSNYLKTFVAAGATAALLGASGPALASGDFAGPYLAGRTAMAVNDFTHAAQYFTRAMTEDPANIEVMESAVLAYVGAGDFARALVVSRRLVEKEPDNNLGRMILLTEAVKIQDWPQAEAIVKEGGAAGPLIDGLAAGWIALGAGDMSRALANFEAVASTEGLAGFGLFHMALAFALAGDMERAEELLSDEGNLGLVQTKHTMVARAQVLVQMGQTDRAIAVLDSYLVQDNAPDIADLRARIAGGERPDFTFVEGAAGGVAEAFYGVGRALAGETDDVYTLVYSRAAQYLAPNKADLALLVAEILEDMERYDLAGASYDTIAPDSPSFPLAELGRAQVMHLAGQTQSAIKTLRDLVEAHPDLISAQVELGDLLRSEESFEQARDAYSAAIDQYDSEDPNLWFVHFMRGITFDKLKDWPRAEADFRRALELRPEQPQVLNYIGYSFVEMRTNLDEALSMIERAVELRPENGYIADSLGWVLYRLGRYTEAVPVMENAAQLLPVDPTINDHLGDVLWAVGRTREARFQWSRAMSFDPEEVDATRIQRKLEVGLDVVLVEEGADPLSRGNDG